MGLDAVLAPFGVTEAMVRKTLEKAMHRGGDFAELYFQRRRGNALALKDGAVNQASSSADLGCGVRVVQGVETGYGYTESLDATSLLQAADVASSVVRSGQGKLPAAISVGRSLGPKYYADGAPWADVDTVRKVGILSDLEKRVTSRDPGIQKVSISFRDEQSDIVVVRSDGHVFVDAQPMTICYVSCVIERDGRRESNYVGRGARGGLEFYTGEMLDQMAREVVERTQILFEAVPGPVGEMPVVLGPGSSGILLHEAIGHGMEADFARRRTTIFTDSVGKRIAPEFVTIVDDGQLPGMRGSIHGDDEGVDSQRTVLVEDGILRTFMHDRISAAHFGVEPTGSGRRQSFRYVPLPRMRNTYMMAGPHAPEEIIASVERGVYADHFTNGQVNIGPGDFTFYIKNGWLIEKGKLTRPIKDVNIIGNGPEVLRNVEMVGTDFKLDQGGWTCGKNGQGVPVGLGMPSVKVGAITVGGTEKA